MSMNIKNKEAHRLTKELAKFTGESLTAAVTVSVRERLDRVRQAQEPSLADQLLTVGKDCAAISRRHSVRTITTRCSMMNAACRNDD